LLNVVRPGAKRKLESYGESYHEILNGGYLSDNVIEELFREDVEFAITSVKIILPPYVFDSQPFDMKLVLVDMCFNLGNSGLRTFKKFLDAVEKKDYNRASDEMIDSRWYSQVGNRSKKLVKMVRGLANYGTY